MTIVRYTTVDDAGQPINPLILDGQTDGGIVQGAGEALVEAIAHDAGLGQVVNASFMDYGVLRADMSEFSVALVEDPLKSHPLRVKGGGEGGIVPALACVMNAVVAALSA